MTIKEKLQSKRACMLDMPTRRNSTFVLLDIAIELKAAFDRIAEENTKYASYFNEVETFEDEDDEITEVD